MGGLRPREALPHARLNDPCESVKSVTFLIHSQNAWMQAASMFPDRIACFFDIFHDTSIPDEMARPNDDKVCLIRSQVALDLFRHFPVPFNRLP